MEVVEWLWVLVALRSVSWSQTWAMLHVQANLLSARGGCQRIMLYAV